MGSLQSLVSPTFKQHILDNLDSMSRNEMGYLISGLIASQALAFDEQIVLSALNIILDKEELEDIKNVKEYIEECMKIKKF